MIFLNIQLEDQPFEYDVSQPSEPGSKHVDDAVFRMADEKGLLMEENNLGPNKNTIPKIHAGANDKKNKK